MTKRNRGIRLTEQELRALMTRGFTVKGYEVDGRRPPSGSELEVINNTEPKFKSLEERDYAGHLGALGEPWLYEPQGFSVGLAGRYWPDFRLRANGRGGFTFHEVKGSTKRVRFLRARSQRGIDKIQIAALLFPEHDWFLVRWDAAREWWDVQEVK